MERTNDDARYYQLVFLWLTDRPKFARYVERVTPFVGPHGGRLDRQVKPETFVAEGLERPDVVNLVSSPDREAFEAFHRDEGFQSVVHLRTESTRMASAQGPSLRGGTSRSDPKTRLYLVELAAYGDGGEAAYRAYEAEAEPVMARYGYHVERAFRPEQASGFPFIPDVVKVAYFDAPDGMDRVHGDPMHTKIENELYPKAAKTSVWVLGASSGP
jgi:uncharacterized protein (DUF1330 family)